MPGIESYGRGKGGRTGTNKTPVKPDELANIFFLRVVADTATFLDGYTDRFKQCPTFQPDQFERQKFVYLVAEIAIALTRAAESQKAIVAVIEAFRSRVRLSMQECWGDTEEHSDSEIEEAASDYAKLLSTNPEEEKSLSVVWAQEWLRRIGIEETNPVTLVKISHAWKLCHISTLKLLSSVQVVGATDSEPQPKPQ